MAKYCIRVKVQFMADIKTAAEWRQAADGLKAQIETVDLNADRVKLTAQYNQAAAASIQAENSPTGTPANPVTTSVPPPASNEPGNNTTPAPLLQTTVGQNAPQPVAPSEAGQTNTAATPPTTPPGNTSATGTTGGAGGPEPQSTLTGKTAATSSGNIQSPYTPLQPDYRVKLSLTKDASALYYDPANTALLTPLSMSGALVVIFPYTPQIQVSYTATYASTDLTHSNYKALNYSNSAVENITITGTFTAQDVKEANYMLAVIHFFKCVTKMFYGQGTPVGLPPPLVFLSGHGEFGFDQHPLVITNFTLSYPDDVDYINAGPQYATSLTYSANTPATPPKQGFFSSIVSRLRGSKLQPGGVRPPPTFSITNTKNVTRVPTKLQIQLTAMPMVSRADISNTFSIKKYASGDLLRGSQLGTNRGIW